MERFSTSLKPNLPNSKRRDLCLSIEDRDEIGKFPLPTRLEDVCPGRALRGPNSSEHRRSAGCPEIHSLDALGFSHISASTLFSESRNSANQRSCAAIGATSIGLVSKRTFLETSAS